MQFRIDTVRKNTDSITPGFRPRCNAVPVPKTDEAVSGCFAAAGIVHPSAGGLLHVLSRRSAGAEVAET